MATERGLAQAFENSAHLVIHTDYDDEEDDDDDDDDHDEDDNEDEDEDEDEDDDDDDDDDDEQQDATSVHSTQGCRDMLARRHVLEFIPIRPIR